MSAAHAPKARVFFALWPDDTVRSTLYEAGKAMQARLAGRLTRAASIHMTLVFVGEIESAILPELARRASAIAFDPFAVRLDVADCWRHNRIAWAGPQTTPGALVDLVGRLRAALETGPIQFDRKPFAAHVTLLRNARCAGPSEPIAPIDWAVRDFVLVRSTVDAGGAAYEVIGRWPAHAAGQAIAAPSHDPGQGA